MIIIGDINVIEKGLAKEIYAGETDDGNSQNIKLGVNTEKLNALVPHNMEDESIPNPLTNAFRWFSDIKTKENQTGYSYSLPDSFSSIPKQGHSIFSNIFPAPKDKPEQALLVKTPEKNKDNVWQLLNEKMELENILRKTDPKELYHPKLWESDTTSVDKKIALESPHLLISKCMTTVWQNEYQIVSTSLLYCILIITIII